ncbi:transcriptional regulator NrdR [Chloroflexi bacterium TSY]|nr:transcriptional regulator NrdR [Chloroflexi bacterium TSY]
MNCPHCAFTRHKVIDTRDTGEAIRRRRQCQNCGQRFTTYETIAASLLVVKSDGNREPYDRQKLLSSIRTATTKRNVSSEEIDQVVERIEDAVYRLGRAEIHSKMLGDLALDHLADLDLVAYIRYASVFLDMNDVVEIRTEIDRVMGRDQQNE